MSAQQATEAQKAHPAHHRPGRALEIAFVAQADRARGIPGNATGQKLVPQLRKIVFTQGPAIRQIKRIGLCHQLPPAGHKGRQRREGCNRGRKPRQIDRLQPRPDRARICEKAHDEEQDKRHNHL